MRRVLPFLGLALTLLLFATSCSGSGSEKRTEKAYSGFTRQAIAIHEKSFNPSGFEYLNTAIDPVVHVTYWQSQFEPEDSDQLDDQQQTPTRFEYNYLSADGTVLVVLRFVFVPWEQQKRIVYFSTVASRTSGIPGGSNFPYPLQEEVMYSFPYGYMTATGFLVKAPESLDSELDKLKLLSKTFYSFQQALDTYIGDLNLDS